MRAAVFSGGGAKGVYQANEFIRQLDEELPVPDIIYGSSVGAVNAAGFAYNGSKILDIWRSIQGRSSVLGFNWKIWKATGIYHTKPLKRLLERHIQGRRSRCRVATCNVDLITREISYIYNDQVSQEVFIESVRASASIPFVISPIGSHVDGGIREITPLYQAIRDGADSISVFLTQPYRKLPFVGLLEREWNIDRGFFPFVKIGARALDIMEHEIFMNDIETCLYYNQIRGKKTIDIKVYSPRPEDLFLTTLEFDPVKIRRVLDENIRMENALPAALKNVA
jgi:predicted acylesterase/phospholipase RssA